MVKENKKKFATPGFFKNIVDKIKKIEPNYSLTQLAKDLRTEKKNLDNLDKCEPIYEKRFDALLEKTMELACDKKVNIDDEVILFNKQTLIDNEIVHHIYETLLDTNKKEYDYKTAETADLVDLHLDHLSDQLMQGDDVNFSDLSIRGFMGSDEIFFSISKQIKISELNDEKNLFHEICQTMKELNEFSNKSNNTQNNNTMYKNIDQAIETRELEDKFSKSFELLLKKGISIFNYRFTYWEFGPDTDEFGRPHNYYHSKTRDVFIFGKRKDRHYITFSEGDPPPEDKKQCPWNTYIDGIWWEEWYKKSKKLTLE